MTIDIGYGVQMVTRAEWGARPPRSVTALDPTYGSTSHWEGPQMGTFPHESCASKVRGIQNFHMDSRNWQDIAYTDVVCPHGWVFEGRDIGARTAANGTNEGNRTAYAVCYMSGEGDPFTPEAQRAQRAALDRLDNLGKAGPGRNCHRDWKQTECPGDTVCAWVKAGQPTPDAPPTDPAPAPVEDLMPFPVIDVPNDPDRNAFLALYPGGIEPLDGEEYQCGVDTGVLQAVKHVSARQYDVAADLMTRLHPAPVAGPPGDPGPPGDSSFPAELQGTFTGAITVVPSSD